MECNFENCGYYTDGECNICGMGTDGEDTFCKYCKDNPNCYYKQLTELKAENYELRENFEGQKNAYKKAYKKLNSMYMENCEYTGKLEQTLQEIKKIAEEDCEFCDDIGGCMDNECRKVRILDLITKAEEE